MKKHLKGCDAVIETLGHVLNFRGMFMHPRYLVTDVARNVCESLEDMKPKTPVKFIMMNTVGCSNPDGSDDIVRNTLGQKLCLGLIQLLLFPFKDSVASVNYVVNEVGGKYKHVQYCIVRPDDLLEGSEATKYELHEHLVTSLFNPRQTHISNIGAFMTDLALGGIKTTLWQKWVGKMPVIVDEVIKTQ